MSDDVTRLTAELAAKGSEVDALTKQLASATKRGEIASNLVNVRADRRRLLMGWDLLACCVEHVYVWLQDLKAKLSDAEAKLLGAAVDSDVSTCVLCDSNG